MKLKIISILLIITIIIIIIIIELVNQMQSAHGLRIWISGGVDSSRLLSFRGGIPRCLANFPWIFDSEVLSLRILSSRIDRSKTNMRNLLGWLETRLAQRKLNYL